MTKRETMIEEQENQEEEEDMMTTMIDLKNKINMYMIGINNIEVK